MTVVFSGSEQTISNYQLTISGKSAKLYYLREIFFAFIPNNFVGLSVCWLPHFSRAFEKLMEA